MIRDKRTFIAINAIGAAGALVVLGYFTYNIVRRMRGPIPPARWTRNMTDRQLWTVKGLLIVTLAVVAFVIVFLRVPGH